MIDLFRKIDLRNLLYAGVLLIGFFAVISSLIEDFSSSVSQNLSVSIVLSGT